MKFKIITGLSSDCLMTLFGPGKTVRKLMAQYGIKGCQIATSIQGQTSVQYEGEANEGQPMSAETPIQIASVSKNFVAFAFLQLMATRGWGGESKLVNVLHEIGSDFRLPVRSGMDSNVVKDITLGQLLSHRAGLNGHYIDGTAQTDSLPSTLESLYGIDQTRGSAEVMYDPGTVHYSGFGFLILQHIIEEALGQSIMDALRECVFSPCGLTHLYSPETEGVDFASGHRSDGTEVEGRFKKFPIAAAGLMGDIKDVATFFSKILEAAQDKGEYSDAFREAAKQMIEVANSKPLTDEEKNFMGCNAVGYGMFMITQEEQPKYIVQQASNDGYKGLVLCEIKTGKSIVLFSNSEQAMEFNAQVLLAKMMELGMIGEVATAYAQKMTALDSSLKPLLAKTYQIPGQGGRIRVDIRNGKLCRVFSEITPDGKGMAEKTRDLVPLDLDDDPDGFVFVDATTGTVYRFNTDATQLTLVPYGKPPYHANAVSDGDQHAPKCFEEALPGQQNLVNQYMRAMAIQFLRPDAAAVFKQGIDRAINGYS